MDVQTLNQAKVYTRKKILEASITGGNVSSVNTKTGAVVLTKSDVGLGNVSNTDTTNATNISTGTLSDARLSTNITTQGNTFNGANQLVKNDVSGKIPVANIPVGLVNIVTVANETARLALTQGTILTLALQADTKIEWAINANKDPSVSANWDNCGSYAAAVASVNGATGAVTISLASLNGIPISYLDADILLATNSDTKIATQKAVKGYVDSKTDQTLKTTSDVKFNSIDIGTGTKVKMKKFTGTMPTVGQSIEVAHGLTQSKIISFSCAVKTGASGDYTLRLPFSQATDIEYNIRVKISTIWLTTGTVGTLVANSPYTIIIWYEV